MIRTIEFWPNYGIIIIKELRFCHEKSCFIPDIFYSQSAENVEKAKKKKRRRRPQSADQVMNVDV